MCDVTKCCKCMGLTVGMIFWMLCGVIFIVHMACDKHPFDAEYQECVMSFNDSFVDTECGGSDKLFFNVLWCLDQGAINVAPFLPNVTLVDEEGRLIVPDETADDLSGNVTANTTCGQLCSGRVTMDDLRTQGVVMVAGHIFPCKVMTSSSCGGEVKPKRVFQTTLTFSIVFMSMTVVIVIWIGYTRYKAGNELDMLMREFEDPIVGELNWAWGGGEPRGGHVPRAQPLEGKPYDPVCTAETSPGPAASTKVAIPGVTNGDVDADAAIASDTDKDQEDVELGAVQQRAQDSPSSPTDASAETGTQDFVSGSGTVVLSDAVTGADKEVCSICLDAFERGVMVSNFPGCAHTFHTDCINQWISHNNHCPLCRRPGAQATSSSQSALSGNSVARHWLSATLRPSNSAVSPFHVPIGVRGRRDLARARSLHHILSSSASNLSPSSTLRSGSRSHMRIRTRRVSLGPRRVSRGVLLSGGDAGSANSQHDDFQELHVEEEKKQSPETADVSSSAASNSAAAEVRTGTSIATSDAVNVEEMKDADASSAAAAHRTVEDRSASLSDRHEQTVHAASVERRVNGVRQGITVRVASTDDADASAPSPDVSDDIILARPARTSIDAS